MRSRWILPRQMLLAGVTGVEAKFVLIVVFLLSPGRTHVMLPVLSLPILPRKPVVVVLEVVVAVAVVLAVAVKVLTPRTCPPHPTSIAAA